MNTKTKIILAETPFVSIQAEGNTIGKLSIFIRFSGCNFQCSYCDSKFTWSTNKNDNIETYDNAQHFVETYSHLFLNSKVQNIVFTGGEPLLYQDQMVDIMEAIEKAKQESLIYNPRMTLNTYEIETNFTVPLKIGFVIYCFDRGFIQFNISPKVQFKPSILDNIKILQKYSIPNFILKFVDDYTVETASKIIHLVEKVRELFEENINVYIMPEGETREKQLARFEQTLDFCKEYNFNFSPRVHVLLWDNKRGV